MRILAGAPLTRYWTVSAEQGLDFTRRLGAALGQQSRFIGHID